MYVKNLFLFREGEDPEESPVTSPLSSGSGEGEESEESPEILIIPASSSDPNVIPSPTIEAVESQDYSAQLESINESVDEMEKGVYACMFILAVMLLYVIISELFKGVRL